MLRLQERHAHGHVSVDHVVRGRLIGDGIGPEPRGKERRKLVSGITFVTDGERLPGDTRFFNQLQGFIARLCEHIEIA